ncbi:MAG: hypothetical protein K6E60_08290 [Saccharofermentans sp.]|nr:hypothetical protein [Saccharofermentans sp.]
MATLKSYTCTSCAGILMSDADQEILDCPFCGNRYDIVEFHADEVLDQANACLNEGSFSASKEKFSQILDNDPQNFDALQGIVLCALKLDSPERLENSDNLSGGDLTEAKKAIIKAKRLSVNEKADYFSKMFSLIKDYEKIVKIEKEKQELLSGDTRNEINEKLLRDFQQFRYEERRASFNSITGGTFKILGMIMLFVTAICLSMYLEDLTATFFTFAMCIGAVIMLIVGVSKKDEEFDAAYDPASDYEKRLNYRIEDHDRSYTIAYRNMKKIREKFAPEDKPQPSVSEGGPATVADTDAPKDIICDKCGATLGLDKAKHVYQCDHCGVAYGVSLFFGMPLEKALNSINTGNYKDAGVRFSSVLMTAPSDFEALLGKILCAGKWTKVSTIRISDAIDETEIQSVSSLIEEAVKNADDKDKPFFRKMKELVSYFEPYRENRELLESLNGKVADMEIRADVYATAFAGANYDDEFKAKRQELVNKTFPAQFKKKKLEEEFKEIQSGLVEERAACLLVK